MEDDKVSEQYKVWFNRGYELRKSMPEVFKGLNMPMNEQSEPTQAFEAGAKQYEKDLELEFTRKFWEREKTRKEQSKNRSRGR